MTPSDSACKPNDFNQVRPAGRSRSNVNSSPALLPSQQLYRNIPPFFLPRMAAGNSVYQPSDCNQSSNLAGFFQHINFSIPPPFSPSVLAAPVPSTLQIPYSVNFTQPSSAPLRGILTNQFDPNENNFISKKYKEKESLFADKILFHTKKTDVRPPIQLHEFSDQLKNFHSFLMKLKNGLENFNLISSQLDITSWNDSVTNFSLQRDSLKRLKQSINFDSTSITLLKYKIKKRQKKRKMRRKRNLIKPKSLSKYEIAYSHRQQLQQVVDKQKQEEKFKMEADSVLFSVRQKKSEANGQIQLLTALSVLHTARIHATNAQSNQSLYDAVCGFNKIIGKLKLMWQRQMEEYLIEENGLKIMLKDQAVTAADEDCSNLKETLGQWLKLLFGTTNMQSGLYFSNYNELIRIRQDWDKYVVDEETNSSKIPAGWVVSKYHDDDAWSKFLS